MADEEIVVLDDDDAVAGNRPGASSTPYPRPWPNAARPTGADRRLVGRTALQDAARRAQPQRGRLGPGPPVVGRRPFRSERSSRSNAGTAYRLLLGVPQRMAQSGQGGDYTDVAVGDVPALPVDPSHVHPVEVEETLSDDEPVELAAQLYGRELNRFVPLGHGGVPMFDVLLTGVGPDGHIFSLSRAAPASRRTHRS